ncbi:MAG: tubulin-like doman-containing protein [Aggregatilineales bacterium]
MPRPALVIGVGGTGSWVLSWLKKDLIETHGSLDDIPVRLLLLDVADIITAVGSAASDQKNQYLRFNDIDPGREFIQLPTDKTVNTTRSIDEAVRRQDDSISHLSQWFCGGHFPVSALSLSDGAGQFRQLGRLSLVQGIHQSGNADPVYAKIQTLIAEITRMVSPGNNASPTIDIHIVGSFAGGSGGGLFLDTAWLVRKIIPNNVRSFVTGLFAMPNVFTSNPSREMRAKSFNAWRELNRMMTIDPDNNSFLLKWGRGDETMYEVDGPVYDHVYLIDSGPGGAPLTENPRDSIFPIMAEAVSFFLDEQSGEYYIQHITTNLNKLKITYPFKGQPTFSTLYVKSWKQPIFHNINVARHQFAMKYLETLLQIQEKQESDSAGNIRSVYTLPEMHLCYQRAVDIMGSNLPDIGNTQFIAELAQIVNIPRNDLQIAVRNYADEAYNLLNLYADMPQTPEGRAVHQEIRDMVDFEVPHVEVTRDSDYVRAQLYDIERLLYGNDARSGGEFVSQYGEFETNTFRGQLYNALETAQNLHIEVFKKRVRFWVGRELNQKGDGHSGLACVFSALNELVRHLETCITFFENVETTLPPLTNLKAEAQHTFDEAMHRAAGEGLFGKMLGNVQRAVGVWKNNEGMYLAAQRDRRAVQRIVMTLNEMYDFVQNQTLRQVRAIIQQLVTDNTVDRVQGLYRGLHESLQNERSRHAFDEKLSSVTHLLKSEGSVPPPGMEKILELVNRTTWSVDEHMNIHLSIQVSDNAPPIELEANMRDPEQTIGLVQQLVVGVADRVVVNIDQKTAVDVIDMEQFARELPECRDTLFAPSATNPQTDEVRTFYIRANATPQQRDQLEVILRDLGLPTQQPHQVEVVGSTNANKIVVFSAREMLMPENFNEWEATMRAYQVTVRGDGRTNTEENLELVRCDHLFAGEKQALAMENRHYKKTGNFPILNHSIVHLLEYYERMEDFLRMWVLRWINIEEASRQDERPMWVIETDNNQLGTTQLSPDDDTDILSVMSRYITHGRDMRGNSLDYNRISRRLSNTINEDWFQDDEKSRQLLGLFRYEAQVCEDFLRLIGKGINNQNKPDEFEPLINELVEELRAEENYHSTLAEYVAYDFSRKVNTGEPLVSNIEAHQQMLEFVLPQMYNTMANRWEGRMGRRPGENGDSPDSGGRRRRR